MQLHPILPLHGYGKLMQELEELHLVRESYELISQAQVGEAGQWHFSQDDLELTGLYLREGPIKKFIELCLAPYQNDYLSKGEQYFKNYNKHYGPKQYFLLLKDLCDLLTRIEGTEFQTEDRPLRMKILLTIAEEVLNHLAWGVYLAYQAAGAKKNFTSPVSLQEMFALREGMLTAARIYLDILVHHRVDKEQVAAIADHTQSGNHFRFISSLAQEKARSSEEGVFFRVRTGSKEWANALYALLLARSCGEKNIKPHAVVARYYDSITAAAFVHAAFSSSSRPEFWFHVYNPDDDALAYGLWNGKNRREILEQINQLPALIRPEQNAAGKILFYIEHAVEDGVPYRDFLHYYQTLGVKELYLGAVEANAEELMTGKFSALKGIQLHFPPRFTYAGAAPLRHFHKYVSNR